MLINRQTIPDWVVKVAKLPNKLLGPTEYCNGVDFNYCIRTAMQEDIEWQQDLELNVDRPLLIERKWYKVWFVKQHFIRPDSFYERLVLKTRFRCIYRRLQKNGDPRKEYVRIMVRALNY
jgi:hypothetical protein